MTRILRVDDHLNIYFLLAKSLADAGYRVHFINGPFLALINGIELYQEIGKIHNRVKVCFRTADQIENKPFREIVHDLKENRSTLKPIENKELIKRNKEITNLSRFYYPDRRDFLEQQELGFIRALGR